MKKFKKNNKRNIMIIISAIVMLGLVASVTLIKSHANFKTSKSFNVIQGKIPNKNSADILLAVTVDGKRQDIFPEKGDYIVWSDCTNDMSVDWDYENWKAKINSDITKPFACNLNFKSYDKFVDNITYNGELVNTYPEKGNLNVKVDCNNIEGSWDYDKWKPILTGANKDTVCDVKFEDIKELLVTREILNQGEFKNVTPEYITDGVNGTTGFKIGGYLQVVLETKLSQMFSWRYLIDLTNFNYLKFYAKKDTENGAVFINICSENDSNCFNKIIWNDKNRTINTFIVDHAQLPTDWTEYTVDISNYTGKSYVYLSGGWWDKSGMDAYTSYSNIRFTNK